MSRRVFKKLLSETIPRYSHQVQEILTDSGMLKYIQQRANLMCTLYRLKIEQIYWDCIATTKQPLISWLSKKSNDFTQQHSINWDHTNTKSNLQHRRKIIKIKLQQLKKYLHIHIQRHPPRPQIEKQWCLQHTLGFIDEALHILTRKGLNDFAFNLERKTGIFEYDMNDIQIVKYFYDLNPNQEQVSIYLLDIFFFPLCDFILD
jgi:hypothetical protein